MKHSFLFLIVFVALFAFSVPVFAADADSAEVPVEELTGDSSYTVTDITVDDVAYTALLPAVVSDLFGQYQPRTQEVTEYLSDGTTVSYEEYVPGAAGVDWTYVTSVVLFCIALFCVFRIIGGILKWN